MFLQRKVKKMRKKIKNEKKITKRLFKFYFFDCFCPTGKKQLML